MCGILLVAEALIKCVDTSASEPASAQLSACSIDGAAAAAAAGAARAAAPAAFAAPAPAQPPAAFLRGLQRRGPDHVGAYTVDITAHLSNMRCRLLLAASLLQLRGARAVRPPLVAPATGGVLCFNGEIFEGLPVGCGDNDGERLLEALERADAEGV
jgi:hypothetical protein